MGCSTPGTTWPYARGEHFQSHVTRRFQHLQSTFKSWRDHFPFYSRSEAELTENIRTFHSPCSLHSLKFSAKKCKHLARKVKILCLNHGHQGFSTGPRNMLRWYALWTSPWQQSTCAKQCTAGNGWLFLDHSSIRKWSHYTTYWRQRTKRKAKGKILVEKGRPFQNLLGRRTRSSIQRSSRYFQKRRKTRVSKRRLCDVIVYGRIGILLGRNSDLDNGERQWEENRGKGYEPFAFLGKIFSGAQRNWTPIEIEACAIVKVFDKMEHVLWGRVPIQVLTGLKNLFIVVNQLPGNQAHCNMCYTR